METSDAAECRLVNIQPVPDSKLVRLIDSVLDSNHFRQALGGICANIVELKDFDVDLHPKYMSKLLTINQQNNPFKQCVFGYTIQENGGTISTYLSKALYDQYANAPDPSSDRAALALLLAMTVAHEYGHVLVRQKALKTPKNFKELLEVDDAGFLVERVLLHPLKLAGFGLRLYAIPSNKLFVWFNKRLTLQKIRLGSYKKNGNTWSLLTIDYIQKLFESESYVRPEEKDDIEEVQRPPGTWTPHRGPDEEPDPEPPGKNSHIEIVHSPPGSFMPEMVCGNQLKLDSKSDE